MAAAGIIGADLGLTIMWGLLVSLCALVAGWLFAIQVVARIHVPADSAAEMAEPPSLADSPSVGKSLLPILLPIVLIVLRSIAELPEKPLGTGPAIGLLGFLGQPVVALLIGVALATLLPKQLDRAMLSSGGWVGEAILAAATIIIITGAGGAFGKVLQNSGIAKIIGENLTGSPMGILLPFVIAAGIKTAQGSSTVAIITTASLVAPLLASLGLDSDTAKALVVVAIGAGAMVVSHANDSFFWVVTQFSGMDVQTGYRLQTLGTLVQGTAAAATVYVISLIVL